jgi:hypothetical protein
MKIKFNPDKDICSKIKIRPNLIIRARESLQEYIETYDLPIEFKYAQSHTIDGAENNLTGVEFPKNALLIFAGKSIRCNPHIIKTVLIKTNEAACFDSSYHLDSAGKSILKIIRFNSVDSSTFLADFYIELNTLICVDLTHNRYGFPILNRIITYLCHKKYLTPIQKKTKTFKFPVEEITYGCDPEFEILYQNQPISIKEKTFGELYNTTEQIGTDGMGAQLELRPEKSKDINHIINNLKYLFKLLENYHIGVRGNRFPLGGHIHIGFIKGDAEYEIDKYCIAKLLKLYDWYLGKPTWELSGKARGAYKVLSACEYKSYGIEYRTLPAAIFISPKICKIVFQIIKHITELFFTQHTFNLPRLFKLKELKKIGISSEDAKTFYKFIKKYNIIYNNENIYEFWTKENKENEFLKYKNYNKTIEFLGEWSDEVKNRIIKMIGVPKDNLVFYSSIYKNPPYIDVEKRWINVPSSIKANISELISYETTFPNNNYLGIKQIKGDKQNV